MYGSRYRAQGIRYGARCPTRKERCIINSTRHYLTGTIVIRTCDQHKTYIFPYFFQPYLVLIIMSPGKYWYPVENKSKQMRVSIEAMSYRETRRTTQPHPGMHVREKNLQNKSGAHSNQDGAQKISQEPWKYSLGRQIDNDLDHLDPSLP